MLIPLARCGARAICRRRPEYVQNTIIVGAGHVGQLIAHKYLQHPEYGINLVGFVDDTPRERRDDLGDLILLGSPTELPELVRTHAVERVVIAFSNEPEEQLLDLVRSLRELDVQIDIVPRLFEIVPPNIGIHGVEGLPLVNLPPFRMARSSLYLKRALDIVVSLDCAAPAGAVVRGRRGADQARLARARVLPADAHGGERRDVRDAQVPDDGRRTPSRASTRSRI